MRVAEAAAKVEATKQRFANEIKANQLDRARRTLTELQAIAGNDLFVTRDAPAMLSTALWVLGARETQSRRRRGAWRLATAGATVAPNDPRFTQLRTDIDTTANRRMEALLSVRGTVDGRELTSLAATYRTNAPDRYDAHKAHVGDSHQRSAQSTLATEPTAHNTYLLAVQGAFEDVAAIQAIRPMAARTPPPVAQPPVAVAPSTITPAVNGNRNGNGQNVAPAGQSPAPAQTVATPNQAPTVSQPTPATQPAPTPAAEPNLSGKWCSDGGLALTFAPNQYVFEFGRGTGTFAVERYERSGATITMVFSDAQQGKMMMEFGDFSSDGQSMTQLRAKRASVSEWQSYNRKFKKCN